MVLLLTACASSAEDSAASASSVVLSQVTVPGVGTVDLFIDNGRFGEPGVVNPDGPDVRDMEGTWVVPAFIDSHVHLAYLDVGQELTRNGVAAAIDLAAPLDTISAQQPLRVLWSGPMITAEGGYPTQGWGSNGYGLEVSGPDAARAAVQNLHGLGVSVIKLSLTSSPSLSSNSVHAAVDEAHDLGLKVATHALSDDKVRLASEAGVDLLAHTPTGSLSPSTVESWSSGAVVSTVHAFSGRANLKALIDAGATLLYGTDLGNTRYAGIDPEEISGLMATGFTPQQILTAGTSAPADFWGLDELGSVEAGKAASFLVLDRDPLEDPLAVTEPIEVWMDGERVK